MDQNAFSLFSEKLEPDLHLDMFSLFVVDLMHDFELGFWKDLFIQLLRLLLSLDAKNLILLDSRCEDYACLLILYADIPHKLPTGTNLWP
jgi:hypothetical protein